MAEYTPDDEARMADDISSIIMRARYGRTGVGTPSDNPLDRRDARRIVEYIASRDARVRRDAAREALDTFTRAEIDRAPDSPVNAYEDQEPLTHRELAQATAWRAIGWLDTQYPTETEDQT